MAHTLVLLETDEDFKDEGNKMKHGLGHPVIIRGLRQENQRVYSLRNEKGESVLTISVRSDNSVYHIVGIQNRAPTREEFDILIPLLLEHGFQNKYDPKTLY